MDRYIIFQRMSLGMAGIKCLGIRFRAFAQSTEVIERVSGALAFASGTDEIEVTRTTGHFGNHIHIIEAELRRSGDTGRFLHRLGEAGILRELAGQEEERTGQDCVFHFRLDKQKAYIGEMVLAADRDVIDVRMKVGVYPAKRESAVRAISDWLSSIAA